MWKRLHAEKDAQVHDGSNGATQIHDSFNPGGYMRHCRHIHQAFNALNMLGFQGKLALKQGEYQILLADHGGRGGLGSTSLLLLGQLGKLRL